MVPAENRKKESGIMKVMKREEQKKEDRRDDQKNRSAGKRDDAKSAG